MNNMILTLFPICLFFLINAIHKKWHCVQLGWTAIYVDAKVLSQIDNITLLCSPTTEYDAHLCVILEKINQIIFGSLWLLLYSYDSL